MKKVLVLLLVIALYNCDLVSDNSSEENKDSMDIRFVLETKNMSQTVANVYLEGRDGNLVTGSTVLVRNTENVATLVGFDFTKGCYSGNIPASSDGKYSVEIISKLLDDKKTQTVEHFILEKTPTIKGLVDSDGNDATLGGELKLKSDISLTWELVDNSTTYQVKILKDGKEVFVSTSKENTLIIPADTLKDSGQYSIFISAQYISGDPLFEKNNYYSYSEKVGTTLLFNGNRP